MEMEWNLQFQTEFRKKDKGGDDLYSSRYRKFFEKYEVSSIYFPPLYSLLRGLSCVFIYRTLPFKL